MADHDTGWRPRGSVETYYGYEVWDLDGVGPHQINDGEVDPDWVDAEGREEPTASDSASGGDSADRESDASVETED